MCMKVAGQCWPREEVLRSKLEEHFQRADSEGGFWRQLEGLISPGLLVTSLTLPTFFRSLCFIQENLFISESIGLLSIIILKYK